MARAAKVRTRIGKRIKDSKFDENQLYSLFRRSDTPSNIGVAFSAGGGADSQAGQNSSAFLPTAGGTMIGPIAFFPQLMTISSGAIDIGKNTENFTSRVILTPESGSTDDLVTITGAEHNGQLLFIQGIQTDTLTLKNSGNIETIDGNDFDIVDDDIIIFQFDVTDNKWQQVTVGKQSVGAASFPLTPNINALGNITGAIALDLSLSTGHYHEGTLTGNVTFTFSNPPADNKEMSFVIDIKQDGVGGHTITWPATVRVDPIVGSGANVRTVVVASTVDAGNNYDVLIVTGAGSTFATVALDNLGSVAINTSLVSDTDDTDDLGNSSIAWADLFINGIRFRKDVSPVNNNYWIGRDVADSDLVINVPTGEGIKFDINGVTKISMNSSGNLIAEDIIVSADITNNGDTTLGSNNADTLNIKADVNSDIIASADEVFTIGDATARWAAVYASIYRLPVTVADSTTLIRSNTGGIEYKALSGDTHDWFINAVSLFNISLSGSIDTVLGFNRAGQSITTVATGLLFDVPSGDEYQFRVGGGGSPLIIDTNGILIKTFTDASRPAASVGAGTVIFNSSDGGLNVSDGSNWRAPSGGWVNT